MQDYQKFLKYKTTNILLKKYGNVIKMGRKAVAVI